MKFIIGIGNPGSQYDGTRHNVGFAVLDEIQSGFKAKWSMNKKLNAQVAEFDGLVTLVKPQTYVNRTGETVSAIEYSSKGAEILFVCDDVNIGCGKLRLRPSGSAGGHHGLESVIQTLGSEDFPRLRLGVGSPQMPDQLDGFVLGRFDPAEKEKITVAVKNAAAICREWIEKDFESAVKKLSVLQSTSSADA